AFATLYANVLSRSAVARALTGCSPSPSPPRPGRGGVAGSERSLAPADPTALLACGVGVREPGRQIAGTRDRGTHAARGQPRAVALHLRTGGGSPLRRPVAAGPVGRPG